MSVGAKIATIGAIIPIIGILIYYSLKILEIISAVSVTDDCLNDIFFYPICAGFGLISLGMSIHIPSKRMKYFLRGKAMFWGLQFFIWSVNEIYKFDNSHLISYVSITCGGILLCIVIFFSFRHN